MAEFENFEIQTGAHRSMEDNIVSNGRPRVELFCGSSSRRASRLCSAPSEAKAADDSAEDEPKGPWGPLLPAAIRSQ